MKEVSVSFLKEGSYKDHINNINNSNADYIHFDVMDGKFVERKNLTVKELITYIDLSKKKNDVHLMVKNPEKYIKALSMANVNNITVHYEIKDLDKSLNNIKACGIKAGIAINPETSIEDIKKYLDKIDLVLIMSVHPGKSGQTFIEESEEKINKLKEYINENNLATKIEVDGGVCDLVLDKIHNADILVSASYLLDDLSRVDLLKNS